MASFAAPLKAKQRGEFGALSTDSCDLWIKNLGAKNQKLLVVQKNMPVCVGARWLAHFWRGIDIRCVWFASDRDLPTFHGSHASPGQVRKISR